MRIVKTSIVFIIILIFVYNIFYRDNTINICYLRGSFADPQFELKYAKPLDRYIRAIAANDQRQIDIPFYFAGSIFLRGPCDYIKQHDKILRNMKFTVKAIDEKEYNRQRQILSSGDYVLELP